MGQFTDYNGLQVRSPAPIGDGGQALNANFMAIADGDYQASLSVVEDATGDTLDPNVDFAKQTATPITTSLWASPSSGNKVIIKNASGGANTIDGNGTNIDGSGTLGISAGGWALLVYVGTEWTAIIG